MEIVQASPLFLGRFVQNKGMSQGTLFLSSLTLDPIFEVSAFTEGTAMEGWVLTGQSAGSSKNTLKKYLASHYAQTIKPFMV